MTRNGLSHRSAIRSHRVLIMLIVGKAVPRSMKLPRVRHMRLPDTAPSDRLLISPLKPRAPPLTTPPDGYFRLLAPGRSHSGLQPRMVTRRRNSLSVRASLPAMGPTKTTMRRSYGTGRRR
jgi:hypothetical protein